MTGAPRLSSVPGVPLALPPWTGGRRALGRRVALGAAVLLLAVPAVLLEAGLIRLPGAGSAPAAPEPPAPRVAAAAPEPARARPQRAAEPRPAADRVVAPAHASALFAQHSWYVLPPAPPPAAPPPPPPPTAPPFPYTFVGSYSHGGEAPVFFLARGDRVLDARVGDRLDGVYQFESAAGGQLVFVYLPLNFRQTIAAGASK